MEVLWVKYDGEGYVKNFVSEMASPFNKRIGVRVMELIIRKVAW